MGFFRRLLTGSDAPASTEPDIPIQEVWQRVATLPLPELSAFWEAEQALDPTMETYLSVVARAYELALRDPEIPMPDRQPALDFAKRISELQERPAFRSVNFEHQDTFKDFINVLRNTGDLNR